MNSEFRLIDELRANSRKHREFIDSLCSKYENVSNENSVDFDFNELLLILGTSSLVRPCSKRKKEELDEDSRIELKDLFFKEKKSRILNLPTHSENSRRLKRVVKKARDSVGGECLKKFFRSLITVPNFEEMQELVEVHLKCNLKILLSLRELPAPEEDSKCVDTLIRQEWDRLSTYLDDEKIILYALNVLQ